MSNAFCNYIFTYYRNNHKCNIDFKKKIINVIQEQSKTPKKRKLKKLIKLNND